MSTSSELADIWSRVRPDRRLDVLAPAPIVLPATPPVDSHRLDGTLWRRHWIDGNRLVVDFIGAGCAEVIGNEVRFNHALDPQTVEHIVLDHLLPLWLAWNGELVVHAALASTGSTGIGLIGPSGAGKSTLVSHLARSGWRVGGDDGIVITDGAPPKADATYPSIRLTDASVELLDVTDTAPIAGKSRLSLAPFRLLDAPVDLGVLAFVEPSAGPESHLVELGPARAHAQLFGATFHADLDPAAALPRMFDRLSTIIEHTTPVQLSVGRGLTGLESARQLLEELVEPS